MNASLLRSVVYIAALCGLYLSTAMLVPAMVDLYYGHKDWRVFATCAFMVGGISLMAAMATRGAPPTFSKRLGFLLVNVLWAVFAVVGAAHDQGRAAVLAVSWTRRRSRWRT